jgi:hypothetical protein
MDEMWQVKKFVGEKPENPRDPKYKLYFMARASHTHLRAHKEHRSMDGEHNYCRAFIHNYLHKGQVRPPECLKKSASKYWFKKVAKPVTQLVPCDVPLCSPCMYGDGKGNLPPYKHKLPIYNGTIRETFRQ